LEYKLLGVCIPGRYSEYLLMVKTIRQKESEKFGIGIDKFEVESEFTKWN